MTGVLLLVVIGTVLVAIAADAAALLWLVRRRR
jgi:hypothetical protein